MSNPVHDALIGRNRDNPAPFLFLPDGAQYAAQQSSRVKVREFALGQFHRGGPALSGQGRAAAGMCYLSP